MSDTTIVARPARSAAPDQLKAILLASVIFGHTFAQAESGDLGKWVIYGFHMPAFLFLSGYMIHVERFTERPWRDLLVHYWRRMLAAWLLVSLLYLASFDRDAYRTVPHFAAVLLLAPAWHLWYIPALFLGLLAIRALAASKPGRVALAVIATVGMALFETPWGQQVLPAVVRAHLDHRYLGYFGWLLLGVATRAGWLRIPHAAVRVAAVAVGAAGWIYGYYGHAWFAAVGFIVLNLGTTLSVPSVLRWLERPVPAVGAALCRIGEYSLWIYLLHPFVTNLTRVVSRPLWEQRVVGLAVTLAVLCAAGLATAGQRHAATRLDTQAR